MDMCHWPCCPVYDMCHSRANSSTVSAKLCATQVGASAQFTQLIDIVQTARYVQGPMWQIPSAVKPCVEMPLTDLDLSHETLTTLQKQGPTCAVVLGQ